jgi:hypothetical protein
VAPPALPNESIFPTRGWVDAEPVKDWRSGAAFQRIARPDRLFAPVPFLEPLGEHASAFGVHTRIYVRGEARTPSVGRDNAALKSELATADEFIR